VLTEATRKYRDILAFGLLGVAALVLLSGLSLLFKDSDDLAGAGFAEKALVFGSVFSSLFILAPLVLSIVLVAAGEATRNAKVVVLVALGIGSVTALFAVITWFAGYGVDETGSFGFGFAGVTGAGKIVGTLLNLAFVGLIALTLLFIVAVYQGFPKPAPVQQQWGQPGQQPWGQPGQQPWGQPGQQAWGQPGQQQWGQPGQQQWGQGYGAAGAAGSGWGDQAQAQAAQQGQPASAWGQPAEPQQWGDSGQQQGWGQPAAQQGWGDSGPQQGWGESGQHEGWGQPADQPADQQWGAAGARAEDDQTDQLQADQQQDVQDQGDSEGSDQGEVRRDQGGAAAPWQTDPDSGSDTPESSGSDAGESESGSDTQVWGSERPSDGQPPAEQQPADEEEPPQKNWWQQ
jgi:hypothetical protein